MGQVKPYQQDRLASEVVGTPGVDKSAGSAMAAAASGLGQLVKGEQTIDAVGNNTLLHGVAAAGDLLGSGLSALRKYKQDQKNHFDDAKLADDIQSFRDNAKSWFNSTTETLPNDPPKAEEEYNKFIDGNWGALKARWQKNPRSYAKLMQNMQEALPAMKDKMSDWASKRQTAMVQNQVITHLENGKDIIRDQQGSIQDRLQGFAEVVSSRKDYLYQMEGPLGPAKRQELERKFDKDASESLFHGFLANRPKDVQAGLRYADNVEKVLDNHRKYGIKLDTDKVEMFRGRIETMREKYTTRFNRDVGNSELEAMFELGKARLAQSAHRNDPEYQQEVKAWCLTQANQVEANMKRVIADPSVPDRVKQTVERSATASIEKYRATMTQADTYMSQFRSEQEKLVREAKQEKREAEREAAHVRAENRRADAYQHRAEAETKRAQAEEKRAETERVQNRIHLMQLELTALTASPEDAARNRPKITDLTNRIIKVAQDADMVGLKVNSAEVGASAIRMNRAAAGVEDDAGFFGVGAGVKQLKGKDLRAKQSAAAKELRYATDSVLGQVRDRELNKLDGFNEKQQATFTREAAKVRALNKPPHEIAARLAGLRADVKADPSLRD